MMTRPVVSYPSPIAFYATPIETMRRTGIFIDTNLLVILVVGLVDRKLVGKHRRARTFTPANYDRLIVEIGDLPVFVTPNTLTEASNLLKSSKDPRFLEHLRVLIEKSKEIVVASSIAARNRDFTRLGLTDTALLEIISAERPLFTVDHDLYSAALAKGEEAAINFTHLQSLL